MPDPLTLDPIFSNIVVKRNRSRSAKKRKITHKKRVQIKRSKPLNKTEVFHRKKHKIDNIVLSTLDDGEVIYGEQSLKARFPKWLERPTIDYDVFADNPRKEAIETERRLDKRFGGDYFYVKPAMHPGTFKVVSKINEEGYADFTKKKKKVPHDKIKGRNYRKLSEEKKDRMKSLNDPESAWRHGKDRDALNRIKVYEKMKRKK